MYDRTATVLYRPEMVAPRREGYSASPMKPWLWLGHARGTALGPYLRVDDGLLPIVERDLRLAHDSAYVRAFLGGAPRSLAASAGNGWSAEYRDSVLMKVGALVEACRRAVRTPRALVVCPTSGDHHAQPSRGAGFCPIAGQVIAGLRLHAEHGIRTAWVDLDEHYGNSIPDCAELDPHVRRAIPIDINPRGRHAAYLEDLATELHELERAIVDGHIDLVCVGHGADSHVWDQLGGSLTTDEWIAAGRATYAMVRGAAERLGRPIPIVTSFFGGYRDDDYASVLELHTADVATALDVLADTALAYHPLVSRPGQRAHSA